MRYNFKAKIFALVLTIIFTVSLLFSFSVGTFAANEVTGNNWMSAVDGSLRITALNIPGSHASATQNVSSSVVSRTQSLSIVQQLNSGARYLEIGFQKTETGFNVMHGVLSCRISSGVSAEQMTASHVLSYLRAFLRVNPTETVLLRIKEDTGSTGTAFYTSFYNLYIKDNSDIWFAENRIPTLDEVRGKIVLLRSVSVDTENFDDSNSGIDFTKYPYITSQAQGDFRRCDISTLSGEPYSVINIQDSSRLTSELKWNDINTFLDSDKSSGEFNFCGTYLTGRTLPQISSQEINALLNTYNFKKGELYGIINMDYLSSNLCELVYGSNEGVTVIPRPTDEVQTTRPSTTYPGIDPDDDITFDWNDDTTDFNTMPSQTEESTTEQTTGGGIFDNIFPDDWWNGEETSTERRTDANGNIQYQNKSSDTKAFLISIAAGVAVFFVSGFVTYFLIKRQNKKQ